ESVTVTIDAVSHRRAVPSTTWTMTPAAASVANTFLATVWGVAQRDHGLSFALAGRELLNYARQQHEDSVMQLVAAGNQAVGKRQLRQAQEIAWQIQQLDPENVQSKMILDATQKVTRRTVAFAQDEKPAAPPKPAADNPQPANPNVTVENPTPP